MAWKFPELNPKVVPSKLAIACPPDSEVIVPKSCKATGRITVIGSGNRIVLPTEGLFAGDLTVRGSGNTVELGAHCAIRGQILVKGHKQTVSVGDHTTFQRVYLLCQEGCDIHIGKWCMFSRNIEIRTTDAHSVISVGTRRRINPPSSVKIGNHVWVSVGVLVSKGTVIADDSIVGAMSFVNTVFEESQVIIAGTPAKIVKRGVTWNRDRRRRFGKRELSAWKRDEDDIGEKEGPEDFT